MRVVAVHAPGGERPLGEAVFAGAADVVHDLAVPVLVDGRADPPRDVVERLVPADRLPPPLPPLPGPLQRREDPVRIGELGDGGGSLGAVAAPRARVLRVPLELAHLKCLAVHVRQQPARRLAVEAGRGDEHVAALDAFGPRARIQLDPVVPALLRGEGGQVDAARARVEGLAAGLDLRAGGGDTVIAFVEGGACAHAIGTDWPACT